jgi:hypothetical protein
MFHQLKQDKEIFRNYLIFIEASNSIVSGGIENFVIEASNYNS